jgi:hypothetical protein
MNITYFNVFHDTLHYFTYSILREAGTIKGTRRVESKNGPTDRKMHAHDIIWHQVSTNVYRKEIFQTWSQNILELRCAVLIFFFYNFELWLHAICYKPRFLYTIFFHLNLNCSRDWYVWDYNKYFFHWNIAELEKSLPCSSVLAYNI